MVVSLKFTIHMSFTGTFYYVSVIYTFRSGLLEFSYLFLDLVVVFLEVEYSYLWQAVQFHQW